MKNNLGFRLWYYFRMGWSTYFAFVFAAINTLVVTYYLAIEKIPSLVTIFPNFFQYVAIIVSIGIPILVGIGYIHFKKSKAFHSENDIIVETNTYHTRQIVNTELLLQLNLKIMELFVKISKNEKLSHNEINELQELNKKISNLMKTRSFTNKIDLNYLRNELN